jgi:hypothetical protein
MASVLTRSYAAHTQRVVPIQPVTLIENNEYRAVSPETILCLKAALSVLCPILARVNEYCTL